MSLPTTYSDTEQAISSVRNENVLTDEQRDVMLIQLSQDVEYIKTVLSQIQKGVGAAMENPSIKAMARNFGVEL